MGKITTAIKKAVTKVTEVPEVKKTLVTKQCRNCNDSGMTCSVCLTGKVQG